ncbi:hypothetical protein OOT55_17690 [Marinimicrobium sp. C6131]|uniref:hypothetical protein n=1 Tax=Marinimicrobium sp. C6131 TaxID=3022676 RepID=UPI00223DD00C|nr:hypothetical protein [Marinimicrobium sp. C6131]UZJ44466.1 hypothetical protein OOT55_17690 [Marinimicrobium sp. C6131]
MRPGLPEDYYIAKFLDLVVIGPAVVGLGVVIWQAFSWLQSGDWQAISVIDFLLWTGLEGAWLNEPTSWIGLWKMLDWMPLSVGGMTLSFILFLAVNIYVVVSGLLGNW